MSRSFLMALFLFGYAITAFGSLWFFYAEEYAKAAVLAAFAILNNAHYLDLRNGGR